MAKRYRARDRTVVKMSRDGLTEENLRSNESRRISKRVSEDGITMKAGGDTGSVVRADQRGDTHRKRRRRRAGRSGSEQVVREMSMDMSEDSSSFASLTSLGMTYEGRTHSVHDDSVRRMYAVRDDSYRSEDDKREMPVGDSEDSPTGTSTTSVVHRSTALQSRSARNDSVAPVCSGHSSTRKKYQERNRNRLIHHDLNVTVPEGAKSFAGAQDDSGGMVRTVRDNAVRKQWRRRLLFEDAASVAKNGGTVVGGVSSEDVNGSQTDDTVSDMVGIVGDISRGAMYRARQKYGEVKGRKRKKEIQKTIQKKKYQRMFRKNGGAGGLRALLEKAGGFSFGDARKKVAEKALAILPIRSHAGAAVAVVMVCLVLLMSLLSFTGIIFESGMTVIAATTYQSTDEEIHDAEDEYLALESALDDQINGIETTHSGYDEYRYQVDEITHNPFHLISYLTVKYGEFTLEDVEAELQELFEAQYTLTLWEEVEIRTRTVTDPDTGEETEEEYEWRILNISLTNQGLDTVVRERLSEEQRQLYDVYNQTSGNRPELFDASTIPLDPGLGGSGGYEVPPEALSDERFARMIGEAEKYLGYPYVWGGSSPSTSFDCSGFVSWVINNSGNGWSVGRQTANGLRGLCTAVSPEDAKPGDLIFFQGTYNTAGASHVGIYVGNGMMIHCGSPIQYTSIQTSYWQGHLLSFGRLP